MIRFYTLKKIVKSFHFLNRRFIFLGKKNFRKSKYSDFVEFSILHRFAFLFAFSPKPYVLEALENLSFFDPKLLFMTSPKRDFLKTIPDGFCWNFV